MRATQVELYRNLNAHSQNRWPSPGIRCRPYQRCAVAVLSGGLLLQDLHVAARRLEGRVRACDSPRRGLRSGADASRSGSLRAALCALRSAHCRRGPCRIAAALTAADAGARVILCDEQCELGGSLLSDPAVGIEGRNSSQWLDSALARLKQNARVSLLPRTTAFGYFPHNLIGLNERLTDHLDSAAGSLAARTALAGTRALGAARHRRTRTAADFSGQRQTGRDAGGGGAHLPASLRRACGFQGRHRHQQRRRLSDGAGPAEPPASRLQPLPMSAATSRGPWQRPRAAPESTSAHNPPCWIPAATSVSAVSP